jgi:tetratricopeptide (TPR) repeat protein
MKDLCGTIGFFIAGTGVFRLVYGAWPPTSGDFLQWLASDSRARWAMAFGLVAGIFGAVVGRKLSVNPQGFDAHNSTATEFGKRGVIYHNERKMTEAIAMFQRAIALHQEGPRETDSAPAYASLGKVYLDLEELDSAEENLTRALSLYGQRPDAQEATTYIERLLEVISERHQHCDEPRTYDDTQHPFSFCIPAGWLIQELVPGFSRIGGRVAISQMTHAATFNVAVGPLERPALSFSESRVKAAKAYVRKVRDRVGSIDAQTFVPVSGEENVVVAEYDTRSQIGGAIRQRRNGFVSILHDDLEYVIQWSAEAEYEKQVRQIIASFKFHTP